MRIMLRLYRSRYLSCTDGTVHKREQCCRSLSSSIRIRQRSATVVHASTSGAQRNKERGNGHAAAKWSNAGREGLCVCLCQRKRRDTRLHVQESQYSKRSKKNNSNGIRVKERERETADVREQRIGTGAYCCQEATYLEETTDGYRLTVALQFCRRPTVMQIRVVADRLVIVRRGIGVCVARAVWSSYRLTAGCG